MRKYYSDEELRKVLGTYLEDSDVIDTRIEETYGMIRNAGKNQMGEAGDAEIRGGGSALLSAALRRHLFSRSHSVR